MTSCLMLERPARQIEAMIGGWVNRRRESPGGAHRTAQRGCLFEIHDFAPAFTDVGA